jgi:uncharacterized membrane protein YdjX (TVP38/TMEM64 family)
MSTRIRAWIPLILLAAMSAAGVAVGSLWPHQIVMGIDWAHSLGYIGCLILFLATVIVSMVGMVPAGLLAFATGAVYGPIVGFAISALGLLVGAAMAFRLSRSWLAPRLINQPTIAKLVASLNHMSGRRTWIFVMITRLSPVAPFSLTSYAFGLSHIKFRSYMTGTAAALLPLMAYLAAGHAAISVTTGADHHQPEWISLLSIGIGFGATLIWIFWMVKPRTQRGTS